ncbi:hypothetical protein RB599_010352 [Gaeumannomyces hyphopodioides]
MPRKKDRGSPTRKSSRLTKDVSEEPTKASPVAEDSPPQLDDSEDDIKFESEVSNEANDVITDQRTDPDHPLQSIEEQQQEKDNPDTTMSNQTLSPPAQQADVAAIVAAVISQLRTQNTSTHHRSTPAESVFGGTAFVPIGVAALPAFNPYNDKGDMTAKNPNYNSKDKRTGVEPGVFNGNKNEFTSWVVRLADKCMEDDTTFKNERSRMAVIYANTTGNANFLLEARYNPSSKNPFANAAEMVATLAAVYHDTHQPTKARAELSKMMYDPADKSMDIHQYIAKINVLADRANIIMEERKSILLEHIPPSLDPRLFNDAEDPDISYETFARNVTGAALAQHRAYLIRKEKQAKPLERDDKRRERRGHKVRFPDVLKDGAVKKDADLSTPKTNGPCYACGRQGHLVRDCPEKRRIAAIFRRLEADGALFDDEESDSSASESGSSGSAGESKN